MESKRKVLQKLFLSTLYLERVYKHYSAGHEKQLRDSDPFEKFLYAPAM